MTWTLQLAPAAAEALMGATRGEVVRWAGTADARHAFRSSLGAWIMGVPWTAGTLTLLGVLVMAASSGRHPKGAPSLQDWVLMGGFILFAGAFVAIGIAMLVHPFLALSKARRTVYAVTDRRIVSLTLGQRSVVTSINPAQIHKIERADRAGGGGTLTIVTGYTKDSEGDIMATSAVLMLPADVHKVEGLILDMLSGRPCAMASGR